MTSWRQDYLLALESRDKSEQSQKALYDACAATGLEIEKGPTDSADLSHTTLAEPVSTSTEPPKLLSAQKLVQASPNTGILEKTRTDLSEAQRSKAVMQSRLQDATNDLQQLKLQSARDRKRLDELTSDKATLTLRLKDRDEELKGKTKLLELNMAEDQAQRLKKENEDLVERWMKRMGKEADAMNEASKFN
ncbi:MAG: hypothetical protein Q9225_000637 [Loekoesia sp. 1 TL-2023]